MIIENKLENKSFGPFASSTGLFLFLGGLAFSYFNLFGLIIAIIGAFIAFTSTGTIIDSESRRIKHADYIFGLVPVGKWVDIRDDMRLGLKTVKRGYVGYIRGTQPMDIQYRDIRIFLYDCRNRPVMAIKKFRTADSAKDEIKDLGSLLGLEII
jgi:hypothetical protein